MGWFWQHIVTASALKGKVWGKKVVIFTLVLFLCNAVMPFIWKKNVKIQNKCQICCIAAESDFSEPWIRVNGPKRATTASIFLLQNEIPQQVQHIWKKAIRSTFREKEFMESQYWEEHISQSHKFDDMDKLSQMCSFCVVLLEPKQPRPFSIAILVFV